MYASCFPFTLVFACAERGLGRDFCRRPPKNGRFLFYHANFHAKFIMRVVHYGTSFKASQLVLWAVLYGNGGTALALYSPGLLGSLLGQWLRVYGRTQQTIQTTRAHSTLGATGSPKVGR